MPGATTTTAANAMQPAVDAEVVRTVFNNESILGLVPRKTIGGNPNYQWNVNSAGNAAAEIYVEGQAAGAAGFQAIVRASVPIIDFRIPVQFSGQLERALATDADRYLDQINFEMTEAQKNLADLITNTFLGTGSNGLDLMVDSTGTYGGIARAGNPWWASQEVALGGALTIVALEDLLMNQMDNDRAAKPTDIWTRQNQIRNYNRLAGPGASTSLTRFVASSSTGSPPYNAGANQSEVYYAHMPWTGIPDMTTTLLYMLDKSKFFIREQEKIKVTQKPYDADGKVFHIEAHMSFVCLSPFVQAKLTGVTA